MRLRAGAASDVGRVRELNEDAFASRPEAGLFVVCDGMGGTAAGEVASGTAVQVIVDEADHASTGDAMFDGYLPQTQRLAEAVQRANLAIVDEAGSDERKAGMGTTVVALRLAGNVASVVHAGDSRAYLWHDGRLEALTTDHSLVEQHVQAGLLARDESLKSEQQNILLRALGRDADVELDLAETPVRPGDYLLLCTDGLTRMVSEDVMAETIGALRDPQRICDRLIADANANGGVDNVTALVVEVQPSSWRAWWTRLRSVWGLS
jgi:protein phosphatase